MTRFVVLGTGTGVGKTVFSCAVLTLARREGLQACGLKPVETGTDRPTDAERLGQAANHFVAPLYSFEPPISPHLAARSVGTEIDLNAVARWVAEHAGRLTLVESAGGAFSPLSLDRSNADLAECLQPATVFLVGSAALGAFHAMRSSLLALEAVGSGLSEGLEIVINSPSSFAEAEEVAAEVLRLNAGLGLRRALVLGPGGVLTEGSARILCELWNVP